jgi:hypothetical protein
MVASDKVVFSCLVCSFILSTVGKPIYFVLVTVIAEKWSVSLPQIIENDEE